MVGNIFISYRREDSPGFARAIYTSLCERINRRSIFMDVDAIEPGLDFVEVIEKAVDDCSVLLAIIGPNWVAQEGGERRLDNSNDYVRVEIASALNRNIRVIPVLVQDTHMPNPEDIPDDLAPLTRRNAVSVTHLRFDADMEQLFKVLKKYASSSPGKSEDASATTKPDEVSHLPVGSSISGGSVSKPKRHWFKAMVSVLLFLVAGYGTALIVKLYIQIEIGKDMTLWATFAAAVIVCVIAFWASFRIWRGKKH